MAEVRKRTRSGSENSDDEDEDEKEKQRHIRVIIARLLTHKEKLTDGLLELLMDRNFGSGGNGESEDEANFGFYDGVSEDEKQILVETAKEQLLALSPVVCNKLLPLVIKQLFEEHERRVAASYGRITVEKTPTAQMAKMYRTAFSQWTESPFVSYAAGNPVQLGNLSVKECFILHVYAFMGCFRSKSDNCYALGITGETSAGKSLVFEDPFTANAHQFLTQEGCGRWAVGKHSLVMYHDISLSVLLKPAECEIFKTLARTEMSSSKIFAGSAYLPPLFILLTSNQRVHSHSVPNPSRVLRERIRAELDEPMAKKGRPAMAQQLLLPTWKSTSDTIKTEDESRPTSPTGKLHQLRRGIVLETNLKANNSLDTPNIRALQSRILEVHCFQRPELDPWCIPRGEKFSRAHVLLGIYETVLSVLENHEREDFYSWPLASYVLTTLCMVSRFFTRHMEGGNDTEQRLRSLLDRLEPGEKQRKIYHDLI